MEAWYDIKEKDIEELEKIDTVKNHLDNLVLISNLKKLRKFFVGQCVAMSRPTINIFHVFPVS